MKKWFGREGNAGVISIQISTLSSGDSDMTQNMTHTSK